MCGEKVRKRTGKNLRSGSPPHVRGKEGTPLENLPKDRITPACAGKRLGNAPVKTYEADHPRMCGEK